MTKFFKEPRIRVTAFVPGAMVRAQVTLVFNDEQIRLLSALVGSTNEVYVDDALMAILAAVGSAPPSQVMLARQTHLTMLGEFVTKTDAIFKRKLREAAAEADQEIAQHLIERGIIE